MVSARPETTAAWPLCAWSPGPSTICRGIRKKRGNAQTFLTEEKMATSMENLFQNRIIASTPKMKVMMDPALLWQMFVCKSKTFSLILAGMCFVIQLCPVWGEEGWRCWDGWYDHDIGGPYEDDEQYCALSRPVSCQPRPSMGIIWALCGAQLQLSLNQDSITSLTLTLKGTRRFQTIFVQSALPCGLDFISERQIYKYLHRGPLSGRAQYLVSSYPHNIIALSSAQAQ